MADLGALHTFPVCPSASVLTHYIGRWNSLAAEEGSDLPERHLTTLLINMLPPEVVDDVRKMGLLNSSHTAIVNDLKADTARWQDHKVAQQHSQQRFSLLHGVGKPRVASLVDGPAGVEHDEQGSTTSTSASGTGSTSPASSDPAIAEKLTLVCAALEKLNNSDRSPTRNKDKPRARVQPPMREGSLPHLSASFKGRWHCCKEGHSRTEGHGNNRKPE